MKNKIKIKKYEKKNFLKLKIEDLIIYLEKNDKRNKKYLFMINFIKKIKMS